MKRFNYITMSVLIFLFFLFFSLQQIIFHDIKESAFLFFQDMMFLPLEILLVTFILDKILRLREKQERLEHMNIVIGAFFSECGTDVIRQLNSSVSNLDEIRPMFDMKQEWENKKFDKIADNIKTSAIKIQSDEISFGKLKVMLLKEKMYLLQLFNNANLLEHGTFTDMLWALFHLLDELENRNNFDGLPETDIEHLSGDVTRAYAALLYEWIYYMKHLKKNYPYLYSLAVRKNPFGEKTDVIIK